jgi:hypothetical protein
VRLKRLDQRLHGISPDDMELHLDTDPEQELADRGMIVADRSGLLWRMVRVRGEDQLLFRSDVVDCRGLECAILEGQRAGVVAVGISEQRTTRAFKSAVMLSEQLSQALLGLCLGRQDRRNDRHVHCGSKSCARVVGNDVMHGLGDEPIRLPRTGHSLASPRPTRFGGRRPRARLHIDRTQR